MKKIFACFLLFVLVFGILFQFNTSKVNAKEIILAYTIRPTCLRVKPIPTSKCVYVIPKQKQAIVLTGTINKYVKVKYNINGVRNIFGWVLRKNVTLIYN